MTAATSSAPRNAPAKGIVYMLAASATLTIMDAAIKWLTADYPVPQIGFMRYGVGIFVAAGMALRLGGIATLRTQRLGGHALRSLFNLVTMLTFYYALQALPLTVQFDATYHIGFPALSYTYHARNMIPYCCAIAIPQPDSFGFHQRSV